ncbi:MAG: hypothetical protein LBD34_00885 [Puniceicoccales bacterium]|jgi:hypothetical protein|nr:hypothetical protein [Puniceicoccales bacterium]
MQVTTSDGKTFGDFEKVQEVAKKLRDTEIVKKSVARQDSSSVMYNGSRISVDDQAALSAQIPSVLNTMRVQSRDGEVYSKSPGFEKEFVECLNFLLAWLGSIKSSAGVNALLMRNALDWLMSTMEVSSADADLESIKSIIRNFQRR